MIFSTYSFVSCEKVKDYNYVLTLTEKPGWLSTLFGAKPKTIRFVGSGTVWYTYPRVKKVGTSIDCMLADFMTYAKVHGKITEEDDE